MNIMSIKHPDSSGYVPDLSIIKQRYKHWRNEKIYTVLGFLFDGERDLWLIEHICYEDVSYSNPSPVLFVRSAKNFFEEVDRICEPGVILEVKPVPRFTRVK